MALADEPGSVSSVSPLDDRRSDIILGAAFEIFAEKGIAGARMVDFTARARLSPETLAVRYGDKEGLFIAVMAWAARRAGLNADMFALVREPAAALERLGVAAYQAALAPEALTVRRLVLSEGWRIARIADGYDALFRQPILATLTRIAALANAKGDAPIEDQEMFAAAFMGWLHADLEPALAGFALPADEKAQARRARAMVRRLLAAFSLRPARQKPGPIEADAPTF